VTESNNIDRVTTIIDMFCGCGGLTEAAKRAAKRLGMNVKLFAINHWEVAIATYQANHTDASTVCADVASVDPLKLVPDRRLPLLIAAPECIFHSRARGNRPVNPQSRVSAWRVVEWAERLIIDELLLENVPEFLKWGPLKEVVKEWTLKFTLPLIPFDKWVQKQMRGYWGTIEEWRAIYDDLAALPQIKEKVKRRVKLTGWVPKKEQEGETFIAFVKTLESFGYTVDWRILKAADYGDATRRERLFIRASRVGPIVWPKPTHTTHNVSKRSSNSQLSLVDKSESLLPYRTALDFLDLNDLGTSIFDRKPPLSYNTLQRIFRGLLKFNGLEFVDENGNPLPIATVSNLARLGTGVNP
jgi:DNA (cytosine-5)-methyltransferase 1